MKKIFKTYGIICLCYAMSSCGNAQDNVQKESPMKKNSSNDTVVKYLEQLNSPDEQIRSDAAVMLYKLKHPEAINACIKTINDIPDKNHYDYTPSVHCLIAIGEPALAPLADMMNSTDANTLLHAYTAIAGITYNIWKVKYHDRQTVDKEWKKWWNEIGLKDESPAKEREESVKKLKQWLSKRKRN